MSMISEIIAIFGGDPARLTRFEASMTDFRSLFADVLGRIGREEEFLLNSDHWCVKGMRILGPTWTVCFTDRNDLPGFFQVKIDRILKDAGVSILANDEDSRFWLFEVAA